MIEEIARVGGVIEIAARARGSTSRCPGCGDPSGRVHSRYQRALADAAIGGQPVRIRLRVRRFRCGRASCARRTFAEQVEGLTVRYGRHSQLLRSMLEMIGLALAGRPGARLTQALAAPVSRMTLLRLVRGLPERDHGELVAVGVDDFAFRRGHVYGTVVIDMETHQPVDVLPDRAADTLTDWFKAHPGVQVVCRDRAGAYAEAARTGAPEAVQVADRWHLWHNLAQAVEKTVIAHRGELRPHLEETSDQEPVAAEQSAAEQSAAEQPAAEPGPIEGRLVARTRERYAAVQQLRERGRSITAIGRELGLDRRTVRRFAHAEHVEELLVNAASRDSLLEAFKPYLHQRFNAGHTDAAALTADLKTLGYRGSERTVRRYLQPFRAGQSAPPALPRPPSVRQITGWLTRHPDSLREAERLDLKQALACSPALAVTAEHVRGFAEILTNRHGEQLDTWMREVDTHGTPALRAFVKGLRKDLDAVTAGLTLDYNSGAVEGNVNRIKTIKRQMYGRASFALLRQRILNPV